MNVRILIDGIVRQTTVLIAQLATSGGRRAPLAHVAGQVFLELARELEGQGVAKKVRADMFGMALRTYHRRTQRLAVSVTDRGRSLWEALIDHIHQEGPVTRLEVFRRFRHDDEASLRGVLRDLTESGIVFSSGTGGGAVYRLADEEELARIRRDADDVELEALVWSFVFREGPATVERLTELSGIPGSDLERILLSLAESGRVERVDGPQGAEYASWRLMLGLDHTAGWEAAVLDHFSAVVKTFLVKLRMDRRATLADETGGSTYHLTLYRGHPMEEEVLGELRRFRRRFTELRERVARHNEGEPALRSGAARTISVHAYHGQYVLEENHDEGDDEAGF
jgi:DNA-binding MarR family transcriptional regulator